MKKYLAPLILAALTFIAIPASRASSTYPLKTCVVTNDDLGDEPVDVNYKGRTIRLCCKSCVKKFNANPEKYVAIIDKEMVKRHK